MLKCLFNASFLAKPLPHCEQIFGKTGRCVLSCLRKSEDLRNIRLHLAQGNFFSSELFVAVSLKPSALALSTLPSFADFFGDGASNGDSF